MKVKDFKRIFAQLDDELEIFVSPLILMTHYGNEGDDSEQILTPNPNERYKVTTAVEAGGYGENGIYDRHIVLAYDDSLVFTLSGIEKDDDSSDLVN